VRPGKRVRLALRVRLLRGPLRTLHVTTRIPRNAPTGPRTLRVIGTPADGEGFSGEEGFLEMLFGEGGRASAPQSLRDVRAAFEGISRYDGTTARIGKRRWRLLRSDDVRIDGRASLRVRVAGPRRGSSRSRPQGRRPPLPRPPSVRPPR